MYNLFICGQYTQEWIRCVYLSVWGALYVQHDLELFFLELRFSDFRSCVPRISALGVSQMVIDQKKYQKP